MLTAWWVPALAAMMGAMGVLQLRSVLARNPAESQRWSRPRSRQSARQRDPRGQRRAVPSPERLTGWAASRASTSTIQPLYPACAATSALTSPSAPSARTARSARTSTSS